MPTTGPGVDASFVTGIIDYKGGIENGRFHGTGELLYYNSMKYRGAVCDGNTHGIGSFEFADGTRYEGEVVHNVVQGLGCYRWPNGGVYFGGVVKGKREGHGVFISPDGSKYEGAWVDGKRQGLGKMTSEGGATYYGEWAKGKREGWGAASYLSKAHYEGHWKADMHDGYGRMTWLCKANANVQIPMGAPQPDTLEAVRAQTVNVGTVMPTYAGPFTPAVAKFTVTLQRYEGEWVNGAMQGYGTYVWIQPSLSSLSQGQPDDAVLNSPFQCTNVYRGDFVAGKRCGHGTLQSADGTVFEATWKDDMKTGPGVIQTPDGKEEKVEFELDETTARKTATPAPPGPGGPATAAKNVTKAKGGKPLPLPPPEATDVTVIDVHDLVQIDEDAANVLHVLRSLRNRLLRSKSTLMASYNFYASLETPYVVSVPYTTMHDSEPERDRALRTAAFSVDPSFVTAEPNKALTTDNPALRSNCTQMERLLIMLRSCCEAERQQAVEAANAGMERAAQLHENTAALFADTDNTYSRPETVSAMSHTPGPGTAGTDLGGQVAVGSVFALAFVPTPTLPPNPSQDHHCLHLWQLWEMMADAEITSPTLSLAAMNTMIRPLLIAQRATQQDTRPCSPHDGMQQISFASFTEFIVRVSHHRMTYDVATLYPSDLHGLSLDAKLDVVFDVHMGPFLSAARALTTSGLGPEWRVMHMAQDAIVPIPTLARSRPNSRKEVSKPGTADSAERPARPPSQAGSVLSSSTISNSLVPAADGSRTNRADPGILGVYGQLQEERTGQMNFVVRCNLDERTSVSSFRHLCVGQRLGDNKQVSFCGMRLDRSLTAEQRRCARERGMLERQGMVEYERVLDINLPFPPRYLLRLVDIASLIEGSTPLLHRIFTQSTSQEDGVMALPMFSRFLFDFGVYGRHRHLPADALMRQVISQVLEVDVDWAVLPRRIYTDPHYLAKQQADVLASRPASLETILSIAGEDPEITLQREKVQQRETMLSWFRPQPGKEEVALHGSQIVFRDVVFLYPQFLQSLVVVAHIVYRKPNKQFHTVASVVQSLQMLLTELALPRAQNAHPLVAPKFPGILLPERVPVRAPPVEEVDTTGKKPAPKKGK